jgi:hypothetical protein
MSATTNPGPETTEDLPRYLRASIPVVSGHLKHRVTVSRVRDEIRYAALRLSAHLAGPSVKSLAAKLEHATGCTIEHLAAEAERWPPSATLERLGN